ncbi:MAG: hypothetical protein QG674_105 [Patescibacteria group bacterium]|jgi:hypothetical protein|nr:hypothetical protein [Patescibacteria group bacterium]
MKNIQKIDNKIRIVETKEQELDIDSFLASEEMKKENLKILIDNLESQLLEAKAELAQTKQNLKDFK